MIKVCVVTGTRAEYGLLRSTLHRIKASSILDLQLVVTGTHLSPEFGLTYTEIVEDGFLIDQKIEMLLSSDSSVGMTKSTGLALCGFADAFNTLSPDLILLLGDRYEIFAAATAAMLARTPIAHIHGGEKTAGAIDDSIRHSITKMSHVHFVATEEYRSRVLQLGEQPEQIHVVGGLAAENINQQTLLSRDELEQQLDFSFGKHNLLVTFHPATLSRGVAKQQMSELLDALKSLENTKIIFTMPNADSESRELSVMINAFIQANSATVSGFTSLGQRRYLSCIQYVDAVVGNSSSGLLEAPSFQKGTINIGERQAGRAKASSVIDCQPIKASITEAFQILYSSRFQQQLLSTINPYDKGAASEKIVAQLESLDYANLLKKEFLDQF